MSLSNDFLDELRGRIGLVSLIGRRVKLTRAGREWKGCCPFHNEKSPSFFVNEDKGFYHCFGCGAHGDAIRFLMEQDGLAFLEAVKTLADEAGLVVPAQPAPDRQQDARAGLRDLIAAAGEWFETQLQTSAGAEARAYLQQRQVPAALQKQFGIGFAPDSNDALLRHLQAVAPDSATPERMEEAGLAGETNGRRYARFRGRLMFPIHDSRGRMVGFGGRILGAGEPKYLNSPDGPAFHKGRLLYNQHRATPMARKSGRLLVVEGYLDVIGLASVGITEAVAPLGTALTEEQMLLLWKLVGEPVLAFDGDAAGLRAGIRAAVRALPLIAAGRSLSFTMLPTGQDPDDLARSGGRAAIEELLARSVPLERFLFDAESQATPLDTPERRAALRARLKALADDIKDPDLRRDYLATWNDRARAASRPTPSRQPATTGSGKRQRRWEPPIPGALAETRAAATAPTEIHIAMLLRLLCDRPALAEQHAEELAQLPLSSPALARARDLLLAGTAPGELLSGYRPLSFDDTNAQGFAQAVASTLAQCLATHQIGQPERHASDPRSDQAMQQAFERNRAAALRVMDHLGMPAAIRGNNGQA